MPNSEEIRDEVIARAESHYRGLSFTYEDFEAILQSMSALEAVRSTDDSYFVLGSYDDDAERRLESVRDRLDNRIAGHAVLMKDLANEWEHSYPKFRLLADYATTIVGVAEHRCGGFLVEMGYFTAVETYFEKTYVCKLSYPNEGIRSTDRTYPFSWMQTGIFDLLAREKRVFVWRDLASLDACVVKIP
jgi:hypothetical protein